MGKIKGTYKKKNKNSLNKLKDSLLVEKKKKFCKFINRTNVVITIRAN